MIAAEVADRRRAWIAPVLFLVSPATFILVRDPYLLDAPLYACFAIATLAGVRRRWLIAGLAVAAGCLIKEPAVLLFPMLGAMALIYRDRSAVRLLAASGVTAVAVFVLVYRSGLLLPVAGSPPLTTGAAGFDVWRKVIERSASVPKYAVSAVLLSWGPVWIAAAAGLWITRHRAFSVAAILVPMLAVGALSTSEWIRLAMLALAVVLPAVAILPWSRTWRAAAFVAVYAVLMLVGWGWPAGTMLKYAIELALVAVGAALALSDAPFRRLGASAAGTA
jgi:4-amino-4-deoxy-L-arabinose transferase-like glycosyltransferase